MEVVSETAGSGKGVCFYAWFEKEKLFESIDLFSNSVDCRRSVPFILMRQQYENFNLKCVDNGN